MIVVDTNVISELMRPVPDREVATWVAAQSADTFFTTVISVAEVQYGLERLPAGKRREALESKATEVFTVFEDRILAFDAAAGRRYGRLVAARDATARPIGMADAQIAATCLVHGAVLATRNGGDFALTGLDVVDPWADT